MVKKQSTLLTIFIIASSLATLLLSSLSFSVKVSYNNYYAAIAIIALIGLSISISAYTCIKHKLLFHLIAGTGYLLCNMLFIYCLSHGAWKAWPFILFQLNFALLFATRVLYTRFISDSLAYS